MKRKTTMSIFVALWIFMTLLGLTAVGALIWAIHTGQFRNLSAGAKSIFDEDEPIGQTTDSFPGRDNE